MKNIKLTILTVLVLHSCVSYKNTPISLGQAATNSKTVKIVRHQGKPLNRVTIEKNDGQYFAVSGSHKTRSEIDSVNVKSVHEIDRRAGSIQTAAIFFTTVGVGAILLTRMNKTMDDFGE